MERESHVAASAVVPTAAVLAGQHSARDARRLPADPNAAVELPAAITARVAAHAGLRDPSTASCPAGAAAATIRQRVAAFAAAPSPHAQGRAAAALLEAMRAALCAPAAPDGATAAGIDDLRVVVAAAVEALLVPLLLEPAVRFAHRTLLNTLRGAVLGTPSWLPAPVASATWRAHVDGAVDADIAAWVRTVPALPSQTEAVAAANVLDVVAVTAAPNFKGLLARHAVPLLRIAAAVFDAAVAAANVDAKSVFACDLDPLRFAVRVATSVVHRLVPTTRTLLERSASVEGRAVVDSLAMLAVGATRMLSAAALPKDVQNAAGLLAATLVTLPGSLATDAAWLHAVCAAAAACDRAAVDAALVRTAFTNLCNGGSGGARPGGPAVDVAAWFGGVTATGRFALYKGLLSHCGGAVSPAAGDGTDPADAAAAEPVATGDGAAALRHLGVLLAEPHATVFTVIMPSAAASSNDLAQPEVRFAAVQCMDSVVRHVLAVTEAAARIVVRPPLPPFVQPSAALDACLRTVNETVLAMWDDPTQSVSGALYATCDAVLAVGEAQARCRLAAGIARDAGSEGHSDDARQALVAALRTNEDRRGKYHLLLALVPRLPCGALLATLATFFAVPTDAPPSAAAAAFTTSLVAVAGSTKVVSAAADVWLALATALEGTTTCAAGAPLPCFAKGTAEWEAAIVAPVVASLTQGGDGRTFGAHNGAVVAHFVAPLVKRDPALLPLLLASVTTAAAGNTAVAVPAVVHVLYRAATGGVDTDPYVFGAAGGAATPAAVRAGLLDHDGTLRTLAFHLTCVTAKSTCRATPAHLAAVELFLALNFNGGGDSTFRNSMLSIFGKWCTRLADSVAAKPQAAAAAAATGVSNSKAKRLARAGAGGSAGPVADDATAREALVADHNAYACSVAAHAASLAALFAGQVAAAGGGASAVSVERTYGALRAWAGLLDGAHAIAAAMPPAAAAAAAAMDAALLPTDPTVLAALVASLDAGWENVRACATAVLRAYFRRYGPAPLLAGWRASAAAAAAATTTTTAVPVVAAFVGDALGRLDDARLRIAEGGVARIVLLLSQPLPHSDTRGAPEQSHGADGGAIGFSIDAVDDSSAGRPALLVLTSEPEAHARLVAAVFAAVVRRFGRRVAAAGAADATWAQRADAPTHGWAALARALLRVAPAACAAAAAPALVAFIDSCTAALAAAGATVGGDVGPAATAGATADGGRSSSFVDCRGHVCARVAADGASRVDDVPPDRVLRRVVNNAWLGVRTATLALEAIVAAVPLGGHGSPLQAATMDSIGHALMRTLLQTKHNGVMSKARHALRCIAAALLRHKDPQFNALPFSFAAFLLGPDGVTSIDEGRVLRRSQGLTHALLPLLEAEDPAVPFAVLPLVMDALVRIARADAAAASDVAAVRMQRHHRVNALNVLKFVYDDSVLAARTSPWLEASFLLAVGGFADNDWAVRNSALMLFASVVRRVVGDHPSKGGTGVNTTFADVAQRLPHAAAFAVGALEDAVRASLAARSLQPGVFPLLMLMSQLAPDATHRPVAGLDVAGVVRRCAALGSLMARGCGAHALPSVVPAADVPAVISAAFPARSSAGSPNATNTAHGALLQLRALHAHYVPGVPPEALLSDVAPHALAVGGAVAAAGGDEDAETAVKAPQSSAQPLRAPPAVAGAVAAATAAAATDVLRSLAASGRAGRVICPHVAAAAFSLAADVLFAPTPACTAVASGSHGAKVLLAGAAADALAAACLAGAPGAAGARPAIDAAVRPVVIAAAVRLLVAASLALAGAAVATHTHGPTQPPLAVAAGLLGIAGPEGAGVCGCPWAPSTVAAQGVWAALLHAVSSSHASTATGAATRAAVAAQVAALRAHANVHALTAAPLLCATLAAATAVVAPRRAVAAGASPWATGGGSKRSHWGANDTAVAAAFAASLRFVAVARPLLAPATVPPASVLLAAAERCASTDVQGWALRAVAAGCAVSEGSGGAAAAMARAVVVRAAAAFAAPSRPLDCRLAAAAALSFLGIPRLAAAATARTDSAGAAATEASAVECTAIATVLLKLLHDDDDAVRTAAAGVATRLGASDGAAAKPQVVAVRTRCHAAAIAATLHHLVELPVAAILAANGAAPAAVTTTVLTAVLGPVADAVCEAGGGRRDETYIADGASASASSDADDDDEGSASASASDDEDGAGDEDEGEALFEEEDDNQFMEGPPFLLWLALPLRAVAATTPTAATAVDAALAALGITWWAYAFRVYGTPTVPALVVPFTIAPLERAYADGSLLAAR